MTYRLVVTTPSGSQRHSSTKPLTTLDETGMSALKVLAGARIAFGREGLAFARTLRNTPVGQTTTHSSGYSFRIEHF